MDVVGRFFLCRLCQAQTLLCGPCDRGQIYCSKDCSRAARRSATRAAGRRYQASRRGRHAHALRARAYRARRNKVTQQGSPPLVADALLPSSLVVVMTESSPALSAPPLAVGRCRRCGVRCSTFVRLDFQRRRPAQRNSSHRHPRGEQFGHSP